jgi:hypothetical protein
VGFLRYNYAEKARLALFQPEKFVEALIVHQNVLDTQKTVQPLQSDVTVTEQDLAQRTVGTSRADH